MALKEVGITSMLTDVVALRVPHATGSLNKAMHQIVDGEVNIEYMYAFIGKSDKGALVIVRVENPEKALEVLKDENVTVVSPEEVYRM